MKEVARASLRVNLRKVNLDVDRHCDHARCDGLYKLCKASGMNSYLPHGSRVHSPSLRDTDTGIRVLKRG
jgi:hypothetical protein